MALFIRRRHSSGTQYRSLMQLLHLDGILLSLVSLLVLVGFFVLYSAADGQTDLLVQQLLHILLAYFLMFVFAQIPPWVYERWSPWIYGFSLLSLLAVLIVGHISLGAQRWISLGFFRFQPSDLMRFAIPMILAWYFAQRELPPNKMDLLITGLTIFIPALITAKEPDLGSAIILLTGGVSVLLFAGVRWRIVLIGLGLLILITPIIWHFMHAYQQQRVLVFLNPERQPLGAGYHIIQSKIAVGSGGWFGKGWMQGTQSHLQFLPEHTTDFIFSVIGEEFGLFGSLLLLCLYISILARGLWIAILSQDTYTRLLSGSLSLMFFVSFFVNAGMVTGILPVVGLPLPLISYGGSSLLTTMIGFGLLMSVHSHRKLL